MRRSFFVVLLSLSLVLAGCNGIALGEDETPPPRFTPAAVPTDAPTPMPVPQLAPGLMGTGITDAFALAEAHTAVLNDTSYTFYENSTVRYMNGTIYNQFTTHVQFAANDSRFYSVQNGSSIDVRGRDGISFWSNGERVIVAQTSNNNTSYGVLPQESFSGPSVEQIYVLFSSVETRVAGRETRNGTTLYRVVATNVTNPTVFESDWQNPRNVSLQALISSQGLVPEYRLNYTATLNGEPVRINQQVRYTDLGNTTVERPPWYDEAIENVSTATPTTG